MIIVGFHAIEALLTNKKKIFSIHAMAKSSNERMKELHDLANKNQIAWKEYQPKDRQRFDSEFRKYGGSSDELESAQGVFAQVPDFAFAEIETLLADAKEKEATPIILFLDSITDPQNLGSILRSAAFFNVAGLVITEHRAAPINAAAIKISSGGFIHVPISQVTNLVQSLEMAKEAGFWVVGLSEHAKEEFSNAPLDVPVALVIGNEEKGIRELTKKTCDFTLSLPALGAIKSLNAAVATAVSLTLVRERQKILKTGKK